MKKSIVITAVMLIFCLLLSSCGGADDTPSLAEGETEINNLILTLPEGYTLKEMGGVEVACCPEYPEKSNSISFATAGKDSPENYTKESLDGVFSSLVAGFTGESSLDIGSIDGCEVLIYSYLLVVDEKPMSAVQYMVFGDNFTDTVTVMLESEDDLALIEQVITSARTK